MTNAYTARRPATSRVRAVRGLQMHSHEWGTPSPAAPPLVLLHGWMDLGASFQFLVDALAQERHVLAPDARGFGATQSDADTFWFADYLGDLDRWLDAVAPGRAVDLLGHSMGGNVAMLYAGLRPQRVRRLVNLEGFGLPATTASEAPARYVQWLDGLEAAPPPPRRFASLADVAQRLMQIHPRLAADQAAWLAPHWAQPADDGGWQLHGAPAHRQAGPLLYRADEAVEIWRRIEAPLLWVEGELTDLQAWWKSRYTRAEFETRMAVLRSPVERARISGAGHMLHWEQPAALAVVLERFLDA